MKREPDPRSPAKPDDRRRGFCPYCMGEQPKCMNCGRTLAAADPPAPGARGIERVLCQSCGGNGVVKIAGGIMVCGRCNGDCYEPQARGIERRALGQVIAEFRRDAADVFEHLKGSDFESSGNAMSAVYHDCAERLEALLDPPGTPGGGEDSKR